MSFFSSPKKLLLLGLIVILLLAIPLFVFVAQKQQETQSTATKATKLSFSPANLSSTAGATLKFDIMLDPGTNQVSFVKLVINYDPAKLEKTGTGLKENTPLAVLDGPTYEEADNPATATISLSVGANPANVITTPTKIATMTFKAISATATPTEASFGSTTEVLSIASGDAISENVLSSTEKALVTIAAALNPTPTAAAGSSANTTNKVPVCSGLSIDRTPSGTAPFSIVFTATGSDADGTIQKVTFNYGDGPTQDITQNGGLGTNSISVQVAHIYNSAGTFTARALLTDNNDGVNDPNACTQTITVTGGTGGSSSTGGTGGTGQAGSGSAELLPTESPLSTAIPTTIVVAPSIPPTGPSDLLLKFGGAATILSILGALLFFIL